MNTVMGQPTDGGHLAGLVHCLSLIRKHKQTPAIFLADPSVPGVRRLAESLRATLADYRPIRLAVTLQAGPYPWSDQTPQTERTETVQLLTNLPRLRAVLGEAFGRAVADGLTHESLPADAVWLAVIRPGWLRVAAVRWLPQGPPTVYYGCTFALAGDGQPLAREAQQPERTAA